MSAEPMIAAERIVIDTVAMLLDLDEAELTPGRTLASLDGWDSVEALRVLVFLERETDSALDFERFSVAVTLADLAAQVAEAIGEAISEKDGAVA